MSDGWLLAVDYGTTVTSAAMAAPGEAPEVFEVDRERCFPSIVVLDGAGELITGRTARSRLMIDPSRGERTPKRYLGRIPRLPIGDGVPVVDAVAAVLDRVAREARRRRGDVAPSQVVLTHPARWDDARLDLLCQAAEAAGLSDPMLVSEPVAAAAYFRAPRPLAEGSHVAVFDLGGGTLDIAVLRVEPGGFEVAGPPGGSSEIGGESFDDLLLAHVVAQVAQMDADLAGSLSAPTGTSARIDAMELREQVREVKESLSDYSAGEVNIKGLDRSIRVTREEFERLIADVVTEAVDHLDDTLRGARLTSADLAALYLTGNASRMPAIARAVHTRIAPLEPTTWGDPKAVVALGAVEYLRAAQVTDTEVPADPASGASRQIPGLTADVIRAAMRPGSVAPAERAEPQGAIPGLTPDVIRQALRR